MTDGLSRRRVLQSGAMAGGVALAGCVSNLTGDGEDPGYEIWALDQGTNTAHIYEPSDTEDDEGGSAFEELATIDFGAEEAEVPHMIDYSSDYEYAAVACTAGAKTVIVRCEDHEVVETLDTGASSHFAGFSPDDEYIHVDVIGEGAIKRIDADLENETFDVVEEIVIAESDAAADHGSDFAGRNPICHSYTGDGYSYHTLGPSYNNAGLVIVDHEDFSIEKLFHGDDDGVPTNCGTMPHPTEDKFYLTAGLPAEDPADGVGEYYIFDTETHEQIDQGSTGGVDAHGFWYTPDGEELWILNRQTDDGIILDPETDEKIADIDDYGPAPDIMWASPDGEYMFVTLRGPEEQSGSPHAAEGETPGFNVLSIEDREIVETIEPDSIENYSDEDVEDSSVNTPDFHGIGVRPLGDYDTEIPTSPPF